MLEKSIFILVILLSSLNAGRSADIFPGNTASSEFYAQYVSKTTENNIIPADRNPPDKDLMLKNEYLSLHITAVSLQKTGFKKSPGSENSKKAKLLKKLLSDTDTGCKSISAYVFRKLTSGIYQSSWNDPVS